MPLEMSVCRTYHALPDRCLDQKLEVGAAALQSESQLVGQFSWAQRDSIFFGVSGRPGCHLGRPRRTSSTSFQGICDGGRFPD